MKLHQKSNVDFIKICQYAVFALIACACFFYSSFVRHFAELNIQLPFLEFPIFVGEILLALCLVMLLLKFHKGGWDFKRKDFIVFAYVLWILFKAIEGYKSGGALAFRHAALFYYALFAWVSYEFYHPRLFNQKSLIILLGSFVSLELLTSQSVDMPLLSYHQLPLMILYLCLTMALKSNKLKMIFGLVGLIVFPIQQLFEHSRSHLVGISAVFVFYWIVFGFYFMKGKKRAYWGAISLVIFIALFARFANKSHLSSFHSFEQIVEEYHRQDSYIKVNEPSFIFEVIQPKIYKKEWQNKNNVSNMPGIINNEKKSVSSDIVNRVVQLSRDSLEAFSKNLSLKDNQLLNDMVNSKYFHDQVEALVIYLSRAQEDQNLSLDELTVLSRRKMNDILTGRLLGLGFTGRSAEIAENYKSVVLQGFLEISREEIGKGIIVDKPRDLGIESNNVLFRYFIWRDMVAEYLSGHLIVGRSFGHPQRSKSIEILDQAKEVWKRDGWITPHNSFLHIVYRAGIVGWLMIAMMWLAFYAMLRDFIKCRNTTGVLLLGIYFYWMVIAHFLVFLELPYTAIPFWVLLGMLLAYRKNMLEANR